MAVIAFDTLPFAERLKQVGVSLQQAEAQAAAFAEVLEVNFKELATKEDLRLTKEGMLGLLLGGVLALILKAFFPL